VTDPTARLILGDALAVLPTLEEQSVDLVVTSPPFFGQRSYSVDPQVWEPPDMPGVEECRHEWGEPVRGTTKFARQGCTDTEKSPGLMVEQQPATGSFCVRCGAWMGQLGGEPTVGLYVAHLMDIFRGVWRVLKNTGVFFLNLGDSRNGSGGAGGDYDAGGIKAGQPRFAGRNLDGLAPKNLCGVPWRVAFALQDDGWYLRQAIIWEKPSIKPDPAVDRFQDNYEFVFLLSKSARYWFDERESGRAGKMAVWTIGTSKYRGKHFAAYPLELAERCIRAGCPEGGTVLDPFMGTGTTVEAALRMGRNAVGIELGRDYMALAESRTAAMRAQTHMF